MTNVELKQYLKDLAVKIRELKNTRKQCEYGYVPGLERARIDYRVHHVASCLLRGRTIDQIEKPAPDNVINMDYVERVMKSIVFVKRDREDVTEEAQ